MNSSSSSILPIRVAILVDCDNVSPDILGHAYAVAESLGRPVLRRGYGHLTTLSNRWQKALMAWSFVPRLQYQPAPGKNTSDIALALDALEALLDNRADLFVVVTSDSDFSGLCHKLRERGGVVHIVGESKTPATLRRSADQFHEWERPSRGSAPDGLVPSALVEPTMEGGLPAGSEVGSTCGAVSSFVVNKPGAPVVKRRPRFIIEVVKELAADGETDGGVLLTKLGQRLKDDNPLFSPKDYGHSGLLQMIRTYDLLCVEPDDRGRWIVRPVPADRDSELQAEDDSSSWRMFLDHHQES